MNDSIMAAVVAATFLLAGCGQQAGSPGSSPLSPKAPGLSLVQLVGKAYGKMADQELAKLGL
jgi:hypothetical protein